VVTVSIQQAQPLTAQVVVGCSMPEVGLALDNKNGQEDGRVASEDGVWMMTACEFITVRKVKTCARVR
jgi:hypothetical protein